MVNLRFWKKENKQKDISLGYNYFLLSLRPLYRKMGCEFFTFSWDKRSIPDRINFPDNIEKKVSSIENGLLHFTDGSSAFYERFIDAEGSKIVVAYKPKSRS